MLYQLSDYSTEYSTEYSSDEKVFIYPMLVFSDNKKIKEVKKYEISYECRWMDKKDGYEYEWLGAWSYMFAEVTSWWLSNVMSI